MYKVHGTLFYSLSFCFIIWPIGNHQPFNGITLQEKEGRKVKEHIQTFSVKKNNICDKVVTFFERSYVLWPYWKKNCTPAEKTLINGNHTTLYWGFAQFVPSSSNLHREVSARRTCPRHVNRYETLHTTPQLCAKHLKYATNMMTDLLTYLPINFTNSNANVPNTLTNG